MRNDYREAGPRGGGPAGGFQRRRGLRSRWAGVAAAVLLVALVAGGGWLWLRSRRPSEPAPSPDPKVTVPAPPKEAPIDLPDLDASDEFVRRMLASLSSRPDWVTWLATDRLVRRFVIAVIAVSAGQSPTDQLTFLKPEGRFRVRASGDSLLVDPTSYRRWDLATAVFVSLDTRGTARAYRQLHPLLEEAYRDLGFRRGSFDDVLSLAIERLLAVPVPEGPIAVTRADSLYLYRDPELEQLSAVQKQLLRLGSANARRVQAKLREVAGALALAAPAPTAR